MNDGSPDDSLALARKLADADERIRVIDLSRNFGHYRAMFAGMEHARGEFVFVIDSDLEEPPECIAALHARIVAGDRPDIVWGYQERRAGDWFGRFAGNLHYRLLRAASSGEGPFSNTTIARLMTRRFANAVLEYRENEVLLNGVMTAVGFHQVAVPVEKMLKGSTTYTFAKKLHLFVQSMIGFSDRPLIAIAWLGLLVTLCALLAAVVQLVLFFATPHAPGESAALVTSVWIVGGLILLAQGITAVYISVIFNEVKRRPRAIVRDVYGRSFPPVTDE